MSRPVSLSSLGRLVVLVLVAVPLGLVSWQLAPDIASYLFKARASTGHDLRASRRLITYRLDSTRPIDFAFSKPVELLRILSSAAIEPGAREPAGGWVYGFRVELLDANGRTLTAHDVYSRSVVRDRENRSEATLRFYRGSQAAITLDDNAQIASESPVSAIRVKALPAMPGIAGVDVRVYERRPFIGTGALAAFRRRSSEEQAELARANAFPADLLTVDEMTNIARNQWRPVGPLGIEGRDYTMLVMYESFGPGAGKETGK